MAKAKINYPTPEHVPPPTITLELSIEEAASVRKVVGRIRDAKGHGKFTGSVYRALAKIPEVMDYKTPNLTGRLDSDPDIILNFTDAE